MDEKHAVLIVDDTPENLRVLGDILEQEGYEVLVATNGLDALENAKATPIPDLILLDIMMPEMDGYEVCRRLKKNEATRDIPIVFLTAMASTEDEAKGLALGAVDYITKPFKLELVKARVINHIALRKAQTTIQHYNTQLEAIVQDRTRQLLEAHERLKSLDAAKVDFLHSISHELRTPANGVLCIGQLAIFSIKDSAEQEMLQSLFNASGDRLIETLDYSLQLAEINVSDTTQKTGKIDLDKLFISTKAEVMDCADKKTLSFVFSGTSPSAIQGNENLFKQALKTIFHALIMIAFPETNLAISFKEDDACVCISINAHGNLLSEAEIKNFFESFSTLRPSSCLESLGFSLPLSAKIIMSMGGHIDIRNCEDGVQVTIFMKKFLISD